MSRKNRLEFYFVWLVLHPTNQISAKKYVRVLKVLYRVRKRYVPICVLVEGVSYFVTYDKLVTNATKVLKAH